MRRVARWCVTYRLAVVTAWIVVLIATVFIESNTGSNYSSGNSLSGTQSATAQNLLKRASPAAAGDSEQIVFATHGGSVTAPATRAQIQPMLAKVAQLPNVASVNTPYGPAGSKQISRNRSVAFATVDFTKDANAISSSQATTFVNTARAPNSRSLQVDVLGQVASSTNASSQSSTMIGVAAALVVLLIVFGSLLAALLPLLSTGIALAAAVSVVGALSNSISMAGFTQQLCILIGLGVGIDYSLFILTRTRMGLRRGCQRKTPSSTHRPPPGARSCLPGSRCASPCAACSSSASACSQEPRSPRRSRCCSRCSQRKRCCPHSTGSSAGES